MAAKKKITKEKTPAEKRQRTASLYRIGEALRDALEKAIDPDSGEINPELEAGLEALEIAFEEKLEACALFVRELDGRAESIKKEEKRLGAYRKQVETEAKRLTSYILSEMEMGSVVNGSLLKLRCKKSVAVEIDDDVEIPDLPEGCFKKEIPEPVYKALKPELKAYLGIEGNEIEGVCVVERKNLKIT